MRSQRKIDHINIAAELEDTPYTNGLEDVQLINDSVPELNIADIDTRAEFLGRILNAPLIINAMTGGIREAKEFNRGLAEIAAAKNIAMAVGSQSISLESGYSETFEIVRRVNPHGILLANISASASPDHALQAIDMIRADGLQVHLNVPQELAMSEGDRDFKGILDNITKIIGKSPVPVIAKEVGFGLSREACRKLYDAGVRYFDVGGRGGTNFIAIEEKRQALLGDDLLGWGIPTAISTVEIHCLDLNVRIIASGGIKSGLEACKCIALGSDMVGIAGHLLKAWMMGGRETLESEIDKFLYQLQCVMLMAGASNLSELRSKPLVILGATAQWLSARGIDITSFARRS